MSFTNLLPSRWKSTQFSFFIWTMRFEVLDISRSTELLNFRKWSISVTDELEMTVCYALLQHTKRAPPWNPLISCIGKTERKRFKTSCIVSINYSCVRKLFAYLLKEMFNIFVSHFAESSENNFGCSRESRKFKIT